jgi:four helix bundle protein
MLESYRDLKVWQRAIEMTLSVYHATTAFPKEEIFGLTSQMRRASVSVASNIAEGYGRRSRGEYKQFLGMARGSNLELQTQIVIASKLDYATPALLKEAEALSIEVERMLNSLIAKL